MIDNTLKRYLLVMEPYVDFYYVVDTTLKANTVSNEDMEAALSCTDYESFCSYGTDIINIYLRRHHVLAESDYPITFKTHPELLI